MTYTRRPFSWRLFFRRLGFPLTASVGGVLYALLMSLLPQPWQQAMRFVNAFALFAALMWIQRDGRARQLEILKRLDDTATFIANSLAAREADMVRARQEMEAARIETERLATVLAERTLRSEEASASALREQTEIIVGKIEGARTELAGDIREGTAASKDSAHAANNANEKLRTVTQEVADLNQRLFESIPPKAQIDDIQKTGHDSHDLLGAMADHKKDGAP